MAGSCLPWSPSSQTLLPTPRGTAWHPIVSSCSLAAILQSDVGVDGITGRARHVAHNRPLLWGWLVRGTAIINTVLVCSCMLIGARHVAHNRLLLLMGKQPNIARDPVTLWFPAARNRLLPSINLGWAAGGHMVEVVPLRLWAIPVGH